MTKEKVLSQILANIRLSLNINSIFSITTEEVRKFLQVERVAIYRFNHDNSGEFVIDSVASEYECLLSQQKKDPQLNKNVSEYSLKYLPFKENYETNLGSSQGKDFRKRKNFRFCNDINQEDFSPCYLQLLKKFQTQAYVIIPIYEHSNLWGLFLISQNSRPRNWQIIEINFLIQIADCFSIALQQNELLKQIQTQKTEFKTKLNAQLQSRTEELAREAEKERALAQVIEKIRQTLDLETIFNTATREIRQLMHADRVGIFQFKPDSNYQEGEFICENVVAPYISALKEQVFDRCFGENYVTDYQKGRILVINDLETANLSPCHAHILARFQIRANLVLPLIKGQELWGLLCLHQCSAPRQWQQSEIDFLKKIAVQLGVALQQADLLAKAEKRSQELQEALTTVQEQKEQQAIIAQQERTISRISSSIRQALDVDKIFQITTQEIRQTLECSRVVVYRFFPDWNGEFVYESSCEDCTPLIVANIKTVWRDTYFQETHGGRYANHESFAVKDIYTIGHSDCHIELLEMFQIRAYLIAPVFVGDQLWGLLAAYQNTGPRDWEEREINLLACIGEQLGLAVQQSELLAQLRETSEKANAANYAKSEFLANMSHELRTPLNAILGFTQLLENDNSLNKKQQEYLNIIGRSGCHLLNLLNDVLEMSKIEAGKISLNENDVDLHQLITTLEEIFILKAQAKNLQLTFQCSSKVPRYIQTDESKLRQVLINLIGNGIKFTESGYVILRLNCSPESNGNYRLSFEVEDTGVGIPPEDLDNLFKPFFQSEMGKKFQEGTGLGLRISQEFVQLMGGIITVKSRPNQGSIFSFNILVNLGEANNLSSVSKKRIVGLSSTQKNYRILVADDKPESRLVLKQMFSPLGMEVMEAENGQETIEIWQKWRPHLIWMDIKMPILDGYEATKIIRKKEQKHKNLATKNRVVIIALTASVFDTQISTLLDAGCDEVISKPFRKDLIYEKTAHYLNLTYLYQEKHKVTKSSKTANQNYSIIIENVQTQIKLMPSDWLKQLEQAVLGARENQIRQLTNQIPPEYSLLQTTLIDLVNSLDFEQITNLIESSYNP